MVGIRILPGSARLASDGVDLRERDEADPGRRGSVAWFANVDRAVSQTRFYISSQLDERATNQGDRLAGQRHVTTMASTHAGRASKSEPDTAAAP